MDPIQLRPPAPSDPTPLLSLDRYAVPPLPVDGFFILEDKIDRRLWALLEFQLCFSRFSLLFLLLLAIAEENLTSFFY